MTMETIIRVTPAEADHAAWAIDPMHDTAGSDPSGGDEDFGYEEQDIPFLRGPGKYGNELVFPTSSNAAAEDFLYRIEEQLKDMIDDEYVRDDRGRLESKGAAELRSSKSLARKVRARFPNASKSNPLGENLLLGTGIVLLGVIGYWIYQRQQGPNPLVSVAAG